MDAFAYQVSALERLQEGSHRVTAARLRVIQVLAEAERALTPQALLELLATNEKALDRMTLYRTLELLERNGLIHRLASTGEYLRCRLGGFGCHHHLVCRRCGGVQEVHCESMAAVERTASAASLFQIERHLVEFIGLCRGCQR